MDDADLSQPIDLAAVTATLRRYAKQIVTGSGIACAVLLGTLMASPDLFTAQSIIAKENSPGSLQDFEGIRVEDRGELGVGTESEASVVQSDEFLAQLTEAVGLSRLLRENEHTAHSKWVAEFQAAVHRVASMLTTDRTSKPDPNEEKIGAFKTLKANLEVRGEEKVPILKIRYTDQDPVLAADVVNAAANLLLNKRHAAREQRLSRTIDALRDQINQVREQIKTATERAGRLRGELKYFSTPSGSILAQQITDATKALSDATVEVSVANARYAAAVSSAGHDQSNRGLNELLDSPLLHSLVTEETALRLEERELSATLGKSYPVQARIKSRLASVDNAIQQEISHLLAAVHQKVIEAQARQKALQERLDHLRTSTAEGGKVDLAVQMNERQLDGLLHSQNGLVRLLQQLQFGTADPDRLHIASIGVPPLLPSEPHRLTTFVMGSAVIVGLAFILAMAHATLTRRCLTLQGVRTNRLAREVFSVPWIERRRRRQLLGNASSARRGLDRHLMRRIRDITLWMTTEKGTQPLSIAVTSIDPGEGKTTISMLLAYGFVSMGRRAVILDCDHCNKGATQWLDEVTQSNLPPAPTFNAKANQITIPAVHHTRCEGLCYATPSKELCLATLAGNTSALKRYLDSLHSEFDVVVIDTPPLGVVTEALNVMPLCSYHLLVADWRTARFDRLERVRQLFERYRSTVDLIVFNRLPEERRTQRALQRSSYDPEERQPRLIPTPGVSQAND
jgi:uncharacterized protein involved in exopolysaccharide biosynthesis/cellulose biosynthesis protein BcsQ